MAYKNNVTPNEKGGYKIRITIGYKADGKAIERTTTWYPDPTIHKTPKQIDRALKETVVSFRKSFEKETPDEKPKHIFKDIAEEWLDSARVNGELSNNSLYEYYKVSEKIYKEIGHLSFEDITVHQIQKFIDGLITSGKSTQKSKVAGIPLSHKSKSRHKNFISGTYKYAIRCKMTDDNPYRRELRRLQDNQTLIVQIRVGRLWLCLRISGRSVFRF
jgi:hypothetical protein